MTVADHLPVPQLITDHLALHAERIPDKVALIGRYRAWNYRELAEAVDLHAQALLAAGVVKGDRVAFMSNPRPEFVISLLACAGIGGVWQGLNPRYSSRELTYVLGDATPRLVFASVPASGRSELVHAVRSTGLSEIIPFDTDDDVAAFASTGARGVELLAARAAVDAADAAAIVYTSGSTGAPKGALVRHSGLVRLGVVQSTYWRLVDPIMICNLPINHIGCIGDLVSVPIVAAATLIVREKFDASDVLRDIEEHRVSALFQIPTQLQRIAAHPDFDSRDLTSLDLVGWGGLSTSTGDAAPIPVKGLPLDLDLRPD